MLVARSLALLFKLETAVLILSVVSVLLAAKLPARAFVFVAAKLKKITQVFIFIRKLLYSSCVFNLLESLTDLITCAYKKAVVFSVEQKRERE